MGLLGNLLGQYTMGMLGGKGGEGSDLDTTAADARAERLRNSGTLGDWNVDDGGGAAPEAKGVAPNLTQLFTGGGPLSPGKLQLDTSFMNSSLTDDELDGLQQRGALKPDTVAALRAKQAEIMTPAPQSNPNPLLQAAAAAENTVAPLDAFIPPPMPQTFAPSGPAMPDGYANATLEDIEGSGDFAMQYAPQPADPLVLALNKGQ